MSALEPRETLELVDRAYRGDVDGEAYHGPALVTILRSVPADAVCRRPIRDAHTIAEIVRHLVLWREWACDRIERGDAPAVAGDGWEAVPEMEWGTELRRLDAAHERLRRLLGALDAAGIDRVRSVVRFVVHHDLHHGGQVALLRRGDASTSRLAPSVRPVYAWSRLPSPPFEEFARRVDETRRWCATRVDLADPEGSLRSATLDPGACFGDRQPRPWSGETLEMHHLEDVAVVDVLALRRRAGLRGHGGGPGPGRLLLVWPGDSLSSQAAHEASRGFLDGNDLPPWDTWVAYHVAAREVIRDSWDRAQTRSLEALVCWIPEPFVPLAQAGLDGCEIELGTWISSDVPLDVVYRRIVDDLPSLGT